MRYLPDFHSLKKVDAKWQINKKGMNFYLKEISKEGIEKLIKNGYLKNTGQGYVNPKKNYRVGYYKTCGGHRYIEDYFSDLARKLR